MPQQSLWNRNFILCVCNNLFLFTYYFALLTILPVYIMQELGGTVKQAGLALTLFLVSSIAVRPFSGLIVERLGKAFSFRASASLFVCFAFSYFWVDSMWSLLAIRFIHGIWFSILTTVTVPIANDFIPEQRKGEGMGYFVMSTNLAVVFGPLIALSVVQYSSFNDLFVLLTVLISLGLIFSWLIPITESVSLQVPETKERVGLSWYDIIELKAVPIGLIALLTAFAYSSIMSFIATYTESKALLAYTSLFFVVFAVSMILVRPWVGKIYDSRGASAVIYPSFLCFALGLVLVSIVNSPWMLWLSAVLIGMGYGSLFPCFQTVAIQSVPKQRMGHAISTFFTLFDLGMAVGSVVIGVVIAHLGFQTTYLICAAIVLLTLCIYKFKVAKTTRRVSEA